jgi:SAM-dependent methyltransferase
MTGPTSDERKLSFGAAAGAYAASRPGYPVEAVRWLLDAADGSVTTVADVGAGTGALTRTLVDLVDDVRAFEPDEGMVAELQRALPDVTTHVSYAESLPLGDAEVDAVVVAQAWHWFDHAAAAAEFARVVRPGGVVGLVWNIRNTRVDWMGDLQDIIGGEDSMPRVATESTQQMEALERDTTDEIDAFLPGVERASFEHAVTMTPEQVVALTATFSYVRLSPRAEQIYAAVRELLATHPQTAGRSTVEFPYITATYRWRRP